MERADSSTHPAATGSMTRLTRGLLQQAGHERHLFYCGKQPAGNRQRHVAERRRTRLDQGYAYENTDALQLNLSTADGVKPRIDRVVLRLSQRAVYLAVLAGTP